MLLKWCPIFDSSPLHQFSKFIMFLLVCWFLGKIFLMPLENSTTCTTIVLHRHNGIWNDFYLVSNVKATCNSDIYILCHHLFNTILAIESRISIALHLLDLLSLIKKGYLYSICVKLKSILKVYSLNILSNVWFLFQNITFISK